MTGQSLPEPDLEADDNTALPEPQGALDGDGPTTTTTPKANDLVFIRKRGRYAPSEQRLLRNSLSAGVGYLEFANSLDFPANVWNKIPVPTFAVVLMVLGGTTALVMSVVAFRDLHLSLKNVRVLRRERAYLLDLDKEKQKDPHAQRLIRAWLALNFRELGWELADRVLMDCLVGVSSIMVGVGTIMATGGRNPSIFLASNLLSGYLGNSFVALYGTINGIWSLFVWRRFQNHKTAVAEQVEDPAVLDRLRRHSSLHQRYALFNGMFTLIASVGSLVSATLWYGYVILVPCVVSSIYANNLWRHKIGYDREPVNVRLRNHDIDIWEDVKFTIAIREKLKTVPRHKAQVEWFAENNEKVRNVSMAQVLTEYGFMEDFCLYLLRHHAVLARELFGSSKGSVVVNPRALSAAEYHDRVNTITLEYLEKEGMRKFRGRERFLLELLGYYLNSRTAKS